MNAKRRGYRAYGIAKELQPLKTECLRPTSSSLLRKRRFSHGVASNIALQVNERALSKRERGRSRSPHREPIGLPPHAPVERTLWEREGNDPAASPCL